MNSGCCDEYNCRRKQPIELYRGDLSGIIYAVTDRRLIQDLGGGQGVFAARKRHDVTHQMEAFVRDNIAWISAILLEEGFTISRSVNG